MEYTAHGVELVIDDILGLDNNNEVSEATSRARTTRDINSDLVGLDLGDWGGLDFQGNFKYSGDGEQLENEESSVDYVTKNGDVEVVHPSLLRNGKQLEKCGENSDLSLVESSAHPRQRLAHVSGENPYLIGEEPGLVQTSGTSNSKTGNVSI